MGCCRRLPPGEGVRPKGMLPERLVVPLRAVALLLLLGVILYAVLWFRELTAIHIFVLALLMAIAAALLRECRANRDFYRWLRDRDEPGP